MARIKLESELHSSKVGPEPAGTVNRSSSACGSQLHFGPSLRGVCLKLWTRSGYKLLRLPTEFIPVPWTISQCQHSSTEAPERSAFGKADKISYWSELGIQGGPLKKYRGDLQKPCKNFLWARVQASKTYRNVVRASAHAYFLPRWI